MKKMNNLLWGLVLIFLGILLGLKAFSIIKFNIFFPGWWTLFLIIPSFIHLFDEESKTSSIITLLIGILFFMACQDFITFTLIFKLIVPISLVIIGLSFIFKDTIDKSIKENIKKLNEKKSNKEIMATFSEEKLNYDNEEFKGIDLTAVFGSINCDLRNAKISDDVIINTSSIFGSVTIYTPKDVNVKVKSNSIFGGVNKKKINNKETNKITIYINSSCLFGGADIK